MSRLDDKGRCCGRKPLVYRTRNDSHVAEVPYQFCCRCDRAFSMAGEQIENWGWINSGLDFVRRPVRLGPNAENQLRSFGNGWKE